MVLVAVMAIFLVSVAFWRLMRRILVILAVLAAAAFVVSRIPSGSTNLHAYRVLLALVGHVTAVSVRQGLAQYIHWGQTLLTHQHL